MEMRPAAAAVCIIVTAAFAAATGTMFCFHYNSLILSQAVDIYIRSCRMYSQAGGLVSHVAVMLP